MRSRRILKCAVGCCVYYCLARRGIVGPQSLLACLQDAAVAALIPAVANSGSRGYYGSSVHCSPPQVAFREVDGLDPPKTALRNSEAITAGTRKEDPLKREPVASNCFFESCGLVEAAIVRMMKRHRRLKHSELLQKVQMYVQLKIKPGGTPGLFQKGEKPVQFPTLSTAPEETKAPATTGSPNSVASLQPCPGGEAHEEQQGRTQRSETDSSSAARSLRRDGALLPARQDPEVGDAAGTAETFSQPAEPAHSREQMKDSKTANEHPTRSGQPQVNAERDDDESREREEEAAKTGIPISVFKKRLESLLEREFIGRDENDP